MKNCVFCKIVDGEIPCYKIYEDADFLGFLDIKPLNPGNSLLIPKKHFRWVYDVPNFGQYWQIAQKIALASIKALDAQSISFLTLGYEVPHAHIRIIPRFPADAHQRGIDISQIQNIDQPKMQTIAQKINRLI